MPISSKAYAQSPLHPKASSLYATLSCDYSLRAAVKAILNKHIRAQALPNVRASPAAKRLGRNPRPTKHAERALDQHARRHVTSVRPSRADITKFQPNPTTMTTNATTNATTEGDQDIMDLLYSEHTCYSRHLFTMLPIIPIITSHILSTSWVVGEGTGAMRMRLRLRCQEMLYSAPTILRPQQYPPPHVSAPTIFPIIPTTTSHILSTSPGNLALT